VKNTMSDNNPVYGGAVEVLRQGGARNGASLDYRECRDVLGVLDSSLAARLLAQEVAEEAVREMAGMELEISNMSREMERLALVEYLACVMEAKLNEHAGWDEMVEGSDDFADELDALWREGEWAPPFGELSLSL